MAYYLHNIVGFKNPLNENILIRLYRKDIEPEQVLPLLATSFKVSYPKGGKFEGSIWASEMLLSVFIEPGDNSSYTDFTITYADEWMAVATDDEQIIFTGFVIPGGGKAEFQDKPYSITLNAVDGLGLLKGVPLTKPDGSDFTGVNYIKDYISAILAKTGLDLDWRLYSNVVESSMQDRTQDPLKDTFNQTGLHSRTFLKSATEFCDCYTCLQRILGEYFTLYQWNGKWVILRLGEVQDSIGMKIWYTEYDSTGNVLSSEQQLENPGAVGKDRLIHPVEVAQFISSDFSVKSCRYQYNYNPWPEIPANNRFDRGIAFRSGNNIDGTIYEDYTIPDWQFGYVDLFDLPHPTMSSIPQIFFRRSRKNQFGVEIEREIIGETIPIDDLNHSFWMRSEGIPLKRGDKIRFELQKKFASNFASGSSSVFTIPAVVYLVANGNAYYLDNNNSGASGIAKWRQAVNLAGQLVLEFPQSSDTREYGSLSILTDPCPYDGTLFVALSVDGPIANTGELQYYNNISIEYLPYAVGGSRQLKGDYAQTSQNTNYKDRIDVEVYISDSQKEALKGVMYRADLTSLTTPTWHRYGKSEARHFKEIGELARYNLMRRRMFRIDGMFDGLKYTPIDNGLVIEPLSFHRQYSFPDHPLLDGRYFVLVPPLSIDYSEGRAEMNFVEVLQDGANDGDQLGNEHIPFKYLFI